LTAGLASQWLAAALRLPAIVILIAAGLLLGPITGLVSFEVEQKVLAELIGLGVAIILFEGGMALKLGEARRVGHGIFRLTVLAPPLAMGLSAVAAHYIGGLSWPVAIVFGAILVVTGPTVITPLLQQAGLNKRTASLLKWEGIVNDPSGVLLAVLSFQFFTIASGDWSEIAQGLALAVVAAAMLGGLGGWAVGRLFRLGFIPAHLKAPLLMVLVLLVFWVSNQIQYEAGLLSVTVMGLVLGNVSLVEREPLREFKEHLTLILVSVLFIVIPTQLSVDDLALIDGRALLLAAAILFLVRPLTILLATIGSDMERGDRIVLAWIAPRGIVAAATAGLFGPALVDAGYADADTLLPLVFLIIGVTVIAHGLTLAPLARRLGLAAEEENGLLIVGANPWTLALARKLKQLDVPVLVSDGDYASLKAFRMEGIRTYFGELLSEHAEHELEEEHLNHLLAATGNHYYNALVCQAEGAEFGHHRTFQLAASHEASQEDRRLTIAQRGYFALEPALGLQALLARLDQGWCLQHSTLRDGFDQDRLEKKLGALDEDWVIVAELSPSGQLHLHSEERETTATRGWTLIYFAPDIEPSQNNRRSEESDAD
jgi:CPA1 family monovalent cation:H+ antiporter